VRVKSEGNAKISFRNSEGKILKCTYYYYYYYGDRK